MVSCQEDLSRIIDYGPGDLDLTIIEIEHRTVLVNGADADNSIIHFKLLDKIDGKGPDYPAITVSDHTTGHNNLKIFIAAHDSGHIQVIGNDA